MCCMAVLKAVSVGNLSCMGKQWFQVILLWFLGLISAEKMSCNGGLTKITTTTPWQPLNGPHDHILARILKLADKHGLINTNFMLNFAIIFS